MDRAAMGDRYQSLVQKAQTLFPGPHALDLVLVADALGELRFASLASEPPPLHTTFRFLWVNGGNIPETTPCVTLSIRDADARLDVRVLAARSWMHPGQLVHHRMDKLSSAEGDALVATAARAGLWKMPASDRIQALDGATWFVEARDPKRHHMVYRISPRAKENAPFRELCLAMLALARIPSELLPSPLQRAMSD